MKKSNRFPGMLPSQITTIQETHMHSQIVTLHFNALCPYLQQFLEEALWGDLFFWYRKYLDDVPFQVDTVHG